MTTLETKLGELHLKRIIKVNPYDKLDSAYCLSPEDVAQIIQAFKDAGYVQPYHTDAEVARAKNKLAAANYMTGQIWYDRFVKEWDSICTTIGSIPNNPEEIPFLYGRIATEAAKRATAPREGRE